MTLYIDVCLYLAKNVMPQSNVSPLNLLAQMETACHFGPDVTTTMTVLITVMKLVVVRTKAICMNVNVIV